MGGPIPLTEIAAYLDIHGIREVERRQEFVRFIRAMDGVYLEWKQKQDAAKGHR